MPWCAKRGFLIFLANGRRLPKISEMRGKPFQMTISILFNATVDAGIVMTTFTRAAEAVGLAAVHQCHPRPCRNVGEMFAAEKVIRLPACVLAGPRRRAA
jgi:hypothetical protein